MNENASTTYIVIAVILGVIAMNAINKVTLEEPYPELTIIDSDNMVSELHIDLDSLFNTEFSTDTWAFELMAEREPFDKKKIFWNASARCPADTGETWGIMEYQEEGRTAEEATRELIKRMSLATDTIIIRKLGLQ